MKIRIKNLFTRRNMAWLFFMFLFTCLCLELFGRYYLTQVMKKSTSPKFRFNSYRVYEHVPGFHEGDNGRDWIVINDQGFRRTENTPREKPEGTIRIFLLGGSAAHGISTAPPYPVVHIYPDETIDAWLEKELSEKYPNRKFEVINAAVTGYQVFQHTPYLQSELLAYHPDLIIFNDGANDHYINNPEYDYYGGYRYQYWKERLQKPSLGGTFAYGMHWLARYSAFARAYEAWRMNKDAEKFYDAERYEQMIIDYTDDSARVQNHRIASRNSFLRSIHANLDLLHAENVKVLVTHQGELVLRDSSLYSEEERSFVHKDHNMQVLYPVVMQELDSLCRVCQVPLVDIVPATNTPDHQGEQVFLDYCHLSPLGGRITAEAMFPAVEKLLGLTPSADSTGIQ